jgi:hypothetical protein
MKFDITVIHNDGKPSEPWIEDYDRTEIKNIDDAKAYAVALIKRFNDTLRPHERPRKVVLVELKGASVSQLHDWSKQNLVTIFCPRMGCYDIMECSRCGITAKRYGLTRLVIDRQFRAKKFQKCKAI